MPYVPPKYPGAIPTAEDLPDRTDDIDWLYAARYNELKKELRAALIELGVDPAGAFDTVVARLDAAAIGDKISEGDSSVEVIDTDADGHVEVKTENVLCGKYHPDGILDLPKQSRCRAYQSASSQSIPHATFTKVILDVETYDEQNEFDKDTHYRFTAKKAGYYLVNTMATFHTPVADKRYMVTISVNGAHLVQCDFDSGAPYYLSPSVSDIVYLGVNDFVEMFVYQDSGAASGLTNNSPSTYISIHKLS